MKTLLVLAEKNFKITIPEDSKITFGPWSPPSKKGEYRPEGERVGTLRIYRKTKDNIVACFAGVTGFRDLSLAYAEEVVREEGAVIWKDDEKGYIRDEKIKREKDWVGPQLEASPEDRPKKKK